MLDKLPLLYKHFDIQEGNEFLLLLALAIRHVPGFSIAKDRPGAKQAWTPWDVALLRFEIKAESESPPGRSYAEAARRIARRGHWKPLLRKGRDPGETLRRRSYTADPQLVVVIEKAFAYECEFESPNNPPGYEEFVRKYRALDSRPGSNWVEAISAL
jgi:hypothetical protein